MAEFQPFHGLRYDPEKVDVSDTIAPPYDVIKGAMRDELAARSPFNVVGVELPAGEGDAKYEEAARLLHQWRESGILVRDDAAFYVYEQEFEVPGTAQIKKRRGVLGALRLEEFGAGVQPHEHTLSGPKQDRLQLLRATHTNTSPIFGLFEDGDGWVAALLETACMSRALCEARDAEGVVHRLWRVTDDETVNGIVAALEDEPILIADGHHRYETALNYRDEQSRTAANWTGEEPANAVLMMCVSTSDEGLVVLPTHRVIKNSKAEDIAQLEENLRPFFQIEPVSSIQDLMNRLAEPDTSARLGMHLEGRSLLLKLRPDAPLNNVLDSSRSAAYNALDVTLLHTLILDKQLGIGAEALAGGARVAYTIDPEEAVRQVESGQGDAAFLLRPTPVEQVREVAASGDKMPQKSTYFYPKLATGLVLRPLD